MLTREEIIHEIPKALTKVYGGQCLDHNNILWKWIGDEYIGKPAVQMKDLRTVWIDDALKTPELIDTRYYNLDGSKKDGQTKQ